MAILQGVKNQNLVTTYDVIEANDRMFIIMEKCVTGDLLKEMHEKASKQVPYTEQEIR
jgi:serine/threonine protein kinase